MAKTLIITATIFLFGIGFFVFSQNDKQIYKNTPVNSEKDNAENIVNTTGDEGSNISSGKVINLSNQGLKTVPQSIFTKTEIEELNLTNNSLSGSLPGEIRLLQNLKVLNLSNNQFTGVPAEIGQLKNLEVLDLSNNKITGLPSELANLSNLKIINLKGNEYSAADLEGIKKGLPVSVVVEID